MERVSSRRARQHAKRSGLPRGWYAREQTPPEPGVYRAARISDVVAGRPTKPALLWWSGYYWEAFENWADYSAADDLLWQGRGRSRHPLLPEDYR